MSIRYLLFAAIAVAAPVSAQRGKGWEGIWQNQKGSVRIKAARCGEAMCGRVVWASPKAREDAAAGGTDRLIGTELFHDFRRDEDGLWYGEVYVPDIDRSFSGTIELADANRLIGTGCLFANIGCKSQTWKRVR